MTILFTLQKMCIGSINGKIRFKQISIPKTSIPNEIFEVNNKSLSSIASLNEKQQKGKDW